MSILLVGLKTRLLDLLKILNWRSLLNYSEKRKALQAIGEVPDWYTTGGYQLFSENYSYENESVKSRFKSIARALSKHIDVYPDWWESDAYTKGKNWEEVFFNSMWDAFIVPSTPLYSNGGLPKRGHTVSCSQSHMDNNLYSRYNLITELAVLTKQAAGTSVDLSSWPAFGDKIGRGGRSDGVMPIIRDIVTCMDEVAQSNRRGSCAYSLNVRHGDFKAVLDNLYLNPESNNVGWIYDDKEINDCWVEKKLDAVERFSETLSVKMPRGKGYYTKIDHMNRWLAEPFKKLGMKTHASQLCQEILLPTDKDHTYSCVLLNYNLHKWNEFPEHIVFIGQVMSDCNVSEYIESLGRCSEEDRNVLVKIKRFTEKFRALGSGVMGLASLFQKERIVWGSLDSYYLNNRIFKHLNKQSIEATKWLAKVLGEPEGCKGFGVRNATRLSLPPTKSTSELCYGVSEGTNPDVSHVFVKQTAGGEIFRISPEFLKLMKERGKYSEDTIKQISKAKGSVQGCDWLTQQEKDVFRVAFEINMMDVLKLAEQRQEHIDQSQSLNLYFSGNADPKYIVDCHEYFFLSDKLLTLYYIYSSRGGEYVEIKECEVCQ